MLWEKKWHNLLEEIIEQGNIVERKNNKRNFQEIISHKFTLDNPRDRLISDPNRSINIFQSVGHFLWITQGSFSLTQISYYQSIAENFSSDRFKMIGAYGPRLFGIHHLNQIEHVITTLTKEPSKRRAIASIYLPQFDQHERVDEVPCTLNLQYLIRNGRLNAVTYMRSQDAFKILPYDVFLFTMLQEYIATFLQAVYDLELGEYHHYSGSFHIYTNDIPQIKDVINNKPNDVMIMKKMPQKDIGLRLRDLNSFEIVLRNTVIAYEKEDKEVNFDFFFEKLQNDFKDEYWRQLGLILICYGTIKMKDLENFNKSLKLLEPIYQYYVQLYRKKHQIMV